MDRNLKIALGVIAGLIVICVCVAVVGLLALNRAGRTIQQSFTDNPTEAAQIGSQIAVFSVPPGYKEGAIRMMGFNMVFLSPEDSSSEPTIMLMQYPSSLTANREELEQNMQRSMQSRWGFGSFELKTVSEETVTIRGEQVTLTVREGQTENQVPIRQLTGVFQGDSGPAILMITGSSDSWDQELVDQFIASIQ